MDVGDRVRVHPSNRTGRIERMVRASDGRTVYEVVFDATDDTDGGPHGESGGLYVAGELERLSESSRPA